MSDSNAAPAYVKIVTILALIWNLIGVVAFIGQFLMDPDQLAKLSELERNVPIWVTISFAFAVFGGTIGSILLLLKKSLAFEIFAISMIGILVQMFYNFFIVNSIEIYGPGGMIMPIMIILIGFYLVWLANTGKTKGWLI